MDRLAAMTSFARVVETGSFSAAARQLNLGQPAVSKTVAQLEAELGVKLLLRSARGLVVTEAGQLFYEGARRTIEQAFEAERAARGEGTGLRGVLRAAAPTTFARLHIVPHIQSFLTAHPELEIDLILDDRMIDLAHEGIDVALRSGDLADSALTARRIATSDRAVLGTPDYLARCGEPQTPSDLALHEAILMGQRRNGAWEFEREGSMSSVSVSGRLRVSSAEGVRTAVLSHIGLTVASVWMFTPELASGAVRRVLTEWRLPGVDLWAIYPTGRLATAKARAFVAFVTDTLRAAPATEPAAGSP